MSNIVYTPSKTLVPFLQSEAFVALVSGPVGSGKSSAAMLKIAYHASRMRKGADGLRRSRAVIVRNTAQMLTDATIPTFMTWFPEGAAGTFARTDKRFFLRFDDVICEVLFRGLDDANDVRRLLSLECSFGVLDEFREIHPDIFNALQGRVGRYPSVANGGCVTDDGTPNHHIWGATNAPDADTFWEQYMTEPPKTAEIFMQPSALSEEADWVHNLVAGYYNTLAEGKDEDWIDVYIHNKFGRSLSGLPVYDKTFVESFHVSKEVLKPVASSSYPITIGLDFGRTPSAVFMQRDPRGRVVVLSEISTSNMGLDTFITTRLKPHISEHYLGYEFVVAPDPAGFMKQQASEMTLVDQLKDAGFKCAKPPTNDPDKRIAAVERLLNQQVEGKAMFLISPTCTNLIKGFRSGYRYKVKKNGEMEDKPDKNEHSHLADATQYGAAVIDMNIRGFGLATARREVKRSGYRYS